MGKLLQLWVSANEISGDQQVHARAPHTACEASQPAAFPTAGRGELLRTIQTDGVGVSVIRFEGVEVAQPRNCLRKPEARVFGRAGCGKSARPVRRGEGGSCYQTSLTLLLYCLCGNTARRWRAGYPSDKTWVMK